MTFTTSESDFTTNSRNILIPELWITYQSEAFEEKETHKFIVKKKIKFGPKHIIFKDKDDRIVEIKTQTPIDYMLREYNE